MRTLGLIGGMTYHATLIYYKNVNDHVQRTLGNGHSATLILRSFDFADIMSHFHAGNHREVLRQLIEAGDNLKSGGAKAFALCVNTCHMKEETRKEMHDLIFGPLADGIVDHRTRSLYVDAVEELVQRGAQGVILGCTELQFVIKPDEVDVPLFETVNLHAKGLAEWMLKD